MATATNGKPIDLAQVREQRKLVHAQIQLAKLEREKKLLEQMLVPWDDFGGSDLWDRLRQQDQFQGGRWIPLSVPSDRRHGANWPMWRTLPELNRIRQKSRVLCAANGYAKGLLRNLTNYVIGKGFAYKVAAKDSDQAEPLAGLVAKVQGVVDHFLRINRWNGSTDPRGELIVTGSREREIYRRVRRDGECFIRLHLLEDGVTQVRFIEPEQIQDPPGVTWQDGWSYGIKHQMTPFEDVENPERYHAVWQDATTPDGTGKETPTGEEISADEVIHLRGPDTDAAIVRGTPDFAYDTAEALERAVKLQKYISIGATIRAATAEVWEHANFTQGQVSGLAAGLTAFTQQNADGQTEAFERIGPGSIRRVPEGQKSVPPPATPDTPYQLQAAQGDGRQACAAFAAPEYWLADASNGNYSSLETATAPPVKNGECEQEYYKSGYARVVWAAVAWAVKCDRLPPEAMDLKLQVEGPSVLHRNELEKAQADQILVGMGSKSPQTVGMEAGLDPDTEMGNLEEYYDRMGQPGSALPLPEDKPPRQQPAAGGGAKGGPVRGSPFDGTAGQGVLLGVPDIRQDESYDCGAAALRSVVNAFGIDGGTEAEFIRALGTTASGGTTPEAIARVARKLGLEILAGPGVDVDDLRGFLDSGRPVLCPIQADEPEGMGSGHWVVVIGYDGDTLTLQDPVNGRLELDAAAFDGRWHDESGGKTYDHYGIAVGK